MSKRLTFIIIFLNPRYQCSRGRFEKKLVNAASSATDPGSRAASEMYESAKGQMTVTSQQRALPLCHATSEDHQGASRRNGV